MAEAGSKNHVKEVAVVAVPFAVGGILWIIIVVLVILLLIGLVRRVL